ncbi:uncharacterized protein J4E79_010500 [Alternaria viburni]|uniref:uncharacterized protein n=1 Tax=Alternaria viburni TaxID=566460 RepID=UPI0020C43E51|nr:uncharacterized protein J4E79_010500 [Alternaria viburni]KAI4646438.1 hypothetical protein J4E79_010500 [Alternaria viburni]
MPNTSPQKQSHATPTNPFGPLIATSFRPNGTLRQYHTYTPAADTPTQDDAFRLSATHATKRRNAQSERRFDGREYTAGDGVATASGRSRSWDSLAEGAMGDDVEDSGDDEGSDASSRTLGRSESSGSTVAGDGEDGKGTSEGVGDSDESMEDSESDRGEDEESETSSHTLGLSEASDSGEDGGDEDSDEEMGESDDGGDVFGESYGEGSRK